MTHVLYPGQHMEFSSQLQPVDSAQPDAQSVELHSRDFRAAYAEGRPVGDGLPSGAMTAAEFFSGGDVSLEEMGVKTRMAGLIQESGAYGDLPETLQRRVDMYASQPVLPTPAETAATVTRLGDRVRSGQEPLGYESPRRSSALIGKKGYTDDMRAARAEADKTTVNSGLPIRQPKIQSAGDAPAQEVVDTTGPAGAVKSALSEAELSSAIIGAIGASREALEKQFGVDAIRAVVRTVAAMGRSEGKKFRAEISSERAVPVVMSALANMAIAEDRTHEGDAHDGDRRALARAVINQVIGGGPVDGFYGFVNNSTYKMRATGHAAHAGDRHGSRIGGRHGGAPLIRESGGGQSEHIGKHSGRTHAPGQNPYASV